MANRISSLERIDNQPDKAQPIAMVILDNNEDFDCEIPSEKTETEIKTTSHAMPN